VSGNLEEAYNGGRVVKKIVLVGIDVSADGFTAAFDRRGEDPEVLEFPNSSRSSQRLCRKLRKKGTAARVCLEATGIYSLDLALALHRA
jgi:transposase